MQACARCGLARSDRAAIHGSTELSHGIPSIIPSKQSELHPLRELTFLRYVVADQVRPCLLTRCRYG